MSATQAGAEQVAQLQAQLTALRGERDQHAHASALMQAEIRRLMEDSDHAVSSMLERMQALPEVGAADLASMAHHIDASLSTFMVLDRKVEVSGAPEGPLPSALPGVLPLSEAAAGRLSLLARPWTLAIAP